jgi:hypothetical protein
MIWHKRAGRRSTMRHLASAHSGWALCRFGNRSNPEMAPQRFFPIFRAGRRALFVSTQIGSQWALEICAKRGEFECLKEIEQPQYQFLISWLPQKDSNSQMSIRTRSPTHTPGNRVEKSGKRARSCRLYPQADIGALRPDVHNVPAKDGKSRGSEPMRARRGHLTAALFFRAGTASGIRGDRGGATVLGCDPRSWRKPA